MLKKRVAHKPVFEKIYNDRAIVRFLVQHNLQGQDAYQAQSIDLPISIARAFKKKPEIIMCEVLNTPFPVAVGGILIQTEQYKSLKWYRRWRIKTRLRLAKFN